MTFLYYINTKENNKEFRKAMKHFNLKYEQKTATFYKIKYNLINIIENKNDFFDKLTTSDMRRELFSFQIFTENDVYSLVTNNTLLTETDLDDDSTLKISKNI